MKHEKIEKRHGAASAALSALVLIGAAVGLFLAYRAYQLSDILPRHALLLP